MPYNNNSQWCRSEGWKHTPKIFDLLKIVFKTDRISGAFITRKYSEFMLTT